ncbi:MULTISPECIES: 2-oxoglutarate dehydrogenase complex dihydrolipoyllysine-residue succinyltransferase [Roseivirga]|jgi:2-oxoglutarate dehydrogenase E2 component (dihydrolipoamide succinyltransferase)|uniref:2-oxoglutarate dehydrogenase complex dihydrolipoyllysine-residue succinyltransferase n=1 Tax=Roseivirga TaxID=290180 RepID=UPI00257DF344|nr:MULTISPECIES: 2-oxoglutarate dehydrogenase complex dihydrolipoyllysine-residue succinyltransferase [Roseivirga]MEC7754332.1 2-oxoglutarate dehydrogenase complex dihydrolipoyllysine-residue succinyltransferase [Bacteroidota bacterium]|tara:strand:- start:10554 stop:12104 length:1551 start_codon:yes stop_codon:yes gene_type:complete
MSLEIKIPAVGESITEVTIAQWFKKDGDFVEMDEVICELESDKATFELNAEAAGKLTIKAEEGATLEIGEVVCLIDTEAQGNSSSSSKEETSGSSSQAQDSSAGPKSTGEIKEMTVPTVGESITEVTISSWLKSDGDYVELDEVIAEVDSDKATFELPAEANGILRIVAEEGSTLEIGALICKIEVTEGGAPASSSGNKDSQENSSANQSGAPSKESYATGHASPAAAKIIAERGLDASQIKGTGKDGRITKEDAENAKAPSKEAPKQPSTAGTSTSIAHSTEGRGERREKMSSLRKTVSRRLVSVKNETAMLTTFNEVNMKPIMDLRKQYKEKFKEKYEVNLGFMSFFTKAVTMALKEWPAVNAQINGDEIVYHDYVDVSIAVSAPKGLMVPVIRNAETLSFDQIEKEVVRLATKARDNKLTIDEMTGGTFTITNGGIFGSMLSTPIINAPQSAILGMHNIVERPMAVNGEVKILPIMYVALSYDHRIIDGRESVSFLVRVKELLEDPTRLLLGV